MDTAPVSPYSATQHLGKTFLNLEMYVCEIRLSEWSNYNFNNNRLLLSCIDLLMSPQKRTTIHIDFLFSYSQSTRDNS